MTLDRADRSKTEPSTASGSSTSAGGKSHTLEILLGKLAEAGDQGEEVSVRELRDAIGRRSFAPLLLLVSLVGLTPVAIMPGMPSFLAVMIGFIAAQIILGYDSIWLPRRVLDRKIERKKLDKAVKMLQRGARIIDKAIRPRLTVLTDRPFSYVIALICLLLAISAPPLEFVPFIDAPLWVALVAFSLALVAHDGALAIAAFILTAAGIALIVKTLF